MDERGSGEPEDGGIGINNYWPPSRMRRLVFEIGGSEEWVPCDTIRYDGMGWDGRGCIERKVDEYTLIIQNDGKAIALIHVQVSVSGTACVNVFISCLLYCLSVGSFEFDRAAFD